MRNTLIIAGIAATIAVLTGCSAHTDTTAPTNTVAPVTTVAVDPADVQFAAALTRIGVTDAASYVGTMKAECGMLQSDVELGGTTAAGTEFGNGADTASKYVRDGQHLTVGEADLDGRFVMAAAVRAYCPDATAAIPAGY